VRILLTMNVPYFPSHGGANKSNRLLLESLVANGHSVRVVVPSQGIPALFTHEELECALAEHASAVQRFADSYLFSINGVVVRAVKDPAQLKKCLSEQLKEFKPDFTLCSTEDPSQNLLDTALKAETRVIYMARTTSFLPFGPQAYFPSETRSKLLENVTAIVTISDFVAGYVRQWSGLKAVSLPLSLFGPGPFPDFSCFEKGFVTILNPCAVKGLSIFLSLAKAFPDVAFAAVPTWGTTIEDRAALNAVRNITVLDPVSNMDQIYSISRIVLVPSLWDEARSRTIVEAALHGIPVLASDAGGIREATDYMIPVRHIERFTTQLDSNMLPVPVVPEQDIAPWVSALTSLLSDEAFYRHRSHAGRAKALEYVSSLSAAPFESFLDDIMAGRIDVAPGILNYKKADAAEADRSAGDVGDKAERLKSLSAEQQALLMRRLQKRQN
jgi:glycosyltransferase involved in cell wall biosynthesis